MRMLDSHRARGFAYWRRALEAGHTMKKEAAMKRSLVALSLTVLATAGCATAPGLGEQFNFDRMQPAHPEQEFDGRREYAGGCRYDNATRTQPG
jgi:predicted small secreted protein